MLFPEDGFFILWHSLILIFLTQVLCCSNSSPFFHFPPSFTRMCWGNKDPNTHIPAKALVWSPPNLLVKVTCPVGCRLAFGPASAVEAGSSSPHGREGLETSIFLRLLRRSHLPSLALLSHTHTHIYMYLYICVALYIYRSNISTWIYPGRCSLCPSALWLPTCCLLVLIQLALGSKLTSYTQYSYRDQPEGAGIQISVMFLVPLVSCSFQSSPPRGIFPEAPAHSCFPFTDVHRQCRKKVAKETLASVGQPAILTPLGVVGQNQGSSCMAEL